MTDILEDGAPVRQATGFVFTEGPLWHPEGFFYFTDTRGNALYRWAPGGQAVKVRDTYGGNGTTFDLQGRLIQCEGPGARLTRMYPYGRVENFVESFGGQRFNRPNDVICHSSGALFFTDPSYRIAFRDRQIPAPDNDTGVWDGAAIYRVDPADDSVHHVVSCEYPNGLAFSADERTMYVANTRTSKFLHRFDLDAAGNVLSRGIFADLNGETPGAPDGVKVDQLGRVFCTGPGGIWVFDADGRRLAVLEFPERAINFAFGGPDLRTLLVCAHSSIYTVQAKVPGLPHPWYARR